MILKAGQLKKKGSSKIVLEPYLMKPIGIKELPEIQHLQLQVYDHLPNKSVLVTDSYESMKLDLETGGMVIGVYNGSGRLVAYRFVTFPKGEHNLGKDLALSQPALKKVAHLETTVVHPDYRGNHLQSETLGVALPMIQAQGYQHVLCTVSPMNPYSLYNVMAHGLKIKALKRKYATEEQKDGLWRFILHRDLTEVKGIQVDQWLHIGLTEFERQGNLIRNGFQGVTLTPDRNTLHYVKYAGAL